MYDFTMKIHIFLFYIIQNTHTHTYIYIYIEMKIFKNKIIIKITKILKKIFLN